MFYACIFLFLLAHSFAFHDPDLGWHLKIGEEILSGRQVPHIETHDYTIAGQRWVDHEWLANVVMYWVYAHFGYFALSLLFSLIVAAVLILMHWFLKRYFLALNKHAVFWILLFQILGITAAIGHLGVRVQEIALLALMALLFIMEAFKEKKRWTILFWLIPLFYLWASLHGSFLIGLAILVAWIMFHASILLFHKKTIFARFKPYLHFALFSQSSILQFAIFSLLAFAATLLTPYYGELYSYLGDWSDRYYATHIQEWLTPLSPPIVYWQVLYLAIFMLSIWLFAVFNSPKKPIALDLWYLSLSALFFVMAIRSMRHFPLFFIVSFPILVPFFSALMRFPKELFGKEKKVLAIVSKTYLFVLTALIFLFCLAKLKPVDNPFQGYCGEYPCRATAFLKESPSLTGLKLLSEYNWGGYLIWAYPERKLFIDGRMPQFKFAGKTLLEEYHNFFDPDLTENKLNDHKIQLVLVSVKDEPTGLDWFERHFLILNMNAGKKNSTVLRKHLEKSPQFEKIYSDETAAIFWRKE